MCDKMQIMTDAELSVFFVWNAELALELREKWRILGGFVGSLAPPLNLQNDQLGLPLQLMPEEVKLLIEVANARLVILQADRILPSTSDGDAMRQHRQISFAAQRRLLKQQKRHNVELHDVALLKAKGQAAKRKKLQCLLADGNAQPSSKQLKISQHDLDLVEVTSEEVDAIREELHSEEVDTEQAKDDNLIVQVLCESSIATDSCQDITERFVYPQSHTDEIRYAVFKNLWNQGNFVTSGLKFGAHYLIYPGDPVRFHASHMVICLFDEKDALSLANLSSWTRVGSTVKKTVLLASVKPDTTEPTYTSIRWDRSH